MFAIAAKLSTYIFTGAEILIFCWQFLDYLLRAQNASKLRFLLLISGVIAYNLANVFVLDHGVLTDQLLRDYISYGSSVILALYYYYFMTRELNIDNTNLNPRYQLTIVISAFCLGFITSPSSPDRVHLYMLLPLVSALYCCYTAEKFLRKSRFYEFEKSKRWFVYSAYSAITFIASMPVISLLGEFHNINISLINLLFLITVCAYIHRLILQIRSENEALNRLGYYADAKRPLLTDFKLTKRQKEIAQLILNGMSYPDIAKTLFIAESTAYRHGADIFKATKTGTREKFEETFSDKN